MKNEYFIFIYNSDNFFSHCWIDSSLSKMFWTRRKGRKGEGGITITKTREGWLLEVGKNEHLFSNKLEPRMKLILNWHLHLVGKHRIK